MEQEMSSVQIELYNGATLNSVVQGSPQYITKRINNQIKGDGVVIMGGYFVEWDDVWYIRVNDVVE